MREMAAVVHIHDPSAFDSVMKNAARPYIEWQIELRLDNERRGANLLQAVNRMRQKRPVQRRLAPVEPGIAGVQPLELLLPAFLLRHQVAPEFFGHENLSSRFDTQPPDPQIIH